MFSYRGRTWCSFYVTCKAGATCDRALTPEVGDAAEEWWGGKSAPVTVYLNAPGCHEKKESCACDKTTWHNQTPEPVCKEYQPSDENYCAVCWHDKDCHSDSGMREGK